MGTIMAMIVLVSLAACDSDGRPEGSARPSATTSPTPSAAATATAPARCGTSGTHTITVAGRRRSFVVDLPTSWNGRTTLPVVFLMHGLGGSGSQILSYTSMATEGEKDGFITVAPNATGTPARWDFRTRATVAGSDAQFILALTKEITSRFCGNPSRQYLAGYSNGSAVAFGFACMAEFDFAAYGAVAGAGYESTCNQAPPTSFIYFHGTADHTVPINGGSTPLGTVQPVDKTFAAWARHDGCAATPVASRVASTVLRRTWTDCHDARLITYTITGGGHTWPGAYPAAFLGPTTEAISATGLMAAFFGLSSSSSR